MNGLPSRVSPHSVSRATFRADGHLLAAFGILFSKISGLIRGRLFSHYLGASAAADAFTAAMRLPGLLQNLFGEGVLSASLIPVYARLVAEGNEAEAGRVAGTIGALIAFACALVVLACVLATPAAVSLVLGGFAGAKRELTIRIAQVLFPSVGLSIMSAWCLSILNSHHKFLTAYAAPVAWNGVILVALLAYGTRLADERLVITVAWAALAGSGLQVLVQLPMVFNLERRLSVVADLTRPPIRMVLCSFFPAVLGTGVQQLSHYIDQYIASYLIDGSVAILTYAQTLSLFPVSIFGVAIAQSELPLMSALASDSSSVQRVLRSRLDEALRRLAFLMVPSAVAFLSFGDLLAAGVYQSGRFDRELAVWVWIALGGSAFGLLSSTIGRIYRSVWYALRDTKTPLRFALIRVGLTLLLGYTSAIPLPRWLGLEPRWGVAGLTLSAGISAWIESYLLRRSLTRRLGTLELQTAFICQLLSAALISVLPTIALRVIFGHEHPLFLAIEVLLVYVAVYVSLSRKWKIAESESAWKRGLWFADALLARWFGRRW